MRKATKEYTDYTNRRKGHEGFFKNLEERAESVPLSEVPISSVMKFPNTPGKPKSDVRNISYSRPAKQVLAVAKVLGSVAMSAKEVGERTFDDFYSKRVEEGD
jgi:hypothetical protein